MRSCPTASCPGEARPDSPRTSLIRHHPSSSSLSAVPGKKAILPGDAPRHLLPVECKNSSIWNFRIFRLFKWKKTGMKGANFRVQNFVWRQRSPHSELKTVRTKCDRARSATLRPERRCHHDRVLFGGPFQRSERPAKALDLTCTGSITESLNPGVRILNLMTHTHTQTYKHNMYIFI